MFSQRFTQFLSFIFQWECVFDRKGNVIAENVQDDNGGVTKYGIDQAGHPNLTSKQIKELTKEEATAVYWGEWQKYGCERYPYPLGEVFFNCAVNCGLSRCNKVFATGVNTADAFLDEQEAFYHRLADQKPNLRKFLQGWLNRTQALRAWTKKEHV